MKINTQKNGKLIMKSLVETSINKYGVDETLDVLTKLEMTDYVKYLNMKIKPYTK